MAGLKGLKKQRRIQIIALAAVIGWAGAKAGVAGFQGGGGHGAVGIGTGEVQGGLALLELLGGGVVAVGAAYGVDDFRPAFCPHPLEVAILTLLADDAGHVRAFTAPAGHRQRGGAACGTSHAARGLLLA